jgi:hypothetical protein
MVEVRDVLRELDLGKSVAEFDDALERYFVETETFRDLVADEGDIVAGDKGTGKTALFKILAKRYHEFPELQKVEVVPGFNPTGNPVFQQLSETHLSAEGDFITVWKAYVLSLAGNWVLRLFEGDFTESMRELDRLLKNVGLRSQDDSPNKVFTTLVGLFTRLANLKAAQVSMSATPQGVPVLIPRLEFEAPQEDGEEPKFIRHEEALGILDEVLEELDLTVWVVLDRLDEAFVGYPSIELPALRALLRTYLDLNAFPHIRLKLFVRNDLFRKITQGGGGFVNLTHVNARKISIVWEDDDLKDLLRRRFAENTRFLELLGVTDGSAIFDAVFPPQVDLGTRKPQTWNWMTGRIRDGNNVKPPRNLIDLVLNAKQAQLRIEQRFSSEFRAGSPVIGADALKGGLTQLSKQRVEDTLLAEAGDYASIIERFRNGKAEHNEETIAALLGTGPAETAEAIKALREIGFLEPVGSSYKIPMIYRQGLGVSQGKAFQPSASTAIEDEDEE